MRIQATFHEHFQVLLILLFLLVVLMIFTLGMS